MTTIITVLSTGAVLYTATLMAAHSWKCVWEKLQVNEEEVVQTALREQIWGTQKTSMYPMHAIGYMLCHHHMYSHHLTTRSGNALTTARLTWQVSKDEVVQSLRKQNRGAQKTRACAMSCTLSWSNSTCWALYSGIVLRKVCVGRQVSKEEVVQSLRKQSRGAQKTSSQYRGVTKHQKGKWEARIGQMVGRKYK